MICRWIAAKASTKFIWQPPYSIEQGVAITVQELLKAINMLRIFDFVFSVGVGLWLPVLLVIYVIGLFDTGSPLFSKKRLVVIKAIYLW